jgi:3-oxoacyl-(acyl-carrier-protein) synthase
MNITPEGGPFCFGASIEGEARGRFQFRIPGRDLEFEKLSLLDVQSKDLSGQMDIAKLRSMNRTTQLLISLAMQMNLKQMISSYSGQRVGLYGAVYGGVFPYRAYDHYVGSVDGSIYDSLVQAIGPQAMLQRSNGISISQLGIYLGIHGPTIPFLHKTWGAVHALDQAVWDLNSDKIDLALVCSALALKEDPFTELDLNVDPKTVERAECAVIVGINQKNQGQVVANARHLTKKIGKFGVANSLVQLAKGDPK